MSQKTCNRVGKRGQAWTVLMSHTQHREGRFTHSIPSVQPGSSCDKLFTSARQTGGVRGRERIELSVYPRMEPFPYSPRHSAPPSWAHCPQTLNLTDLRESEFSLQKENTEHCQVGSKNCRRFHISNNGEG